MLYLSRMKKNFTQETPLKVFTTFSGYDTQCLALKKAHIPFDLVGWSEIEPRAIKAHNLIFPEYAERNYGDICKIDWKNVPDFDFFTYSSPCTNFSISGLREGGDEGSGTKSSLLWECKKAIEIKKPKYLLMENVKNLVGKTFIDTFYSWLDYLESQGYTNYWKVLNGVDYGIPQARERVFCVSILNPEERFYFPKGIQLKKNVYDYSLTKEELGDTYNELVMPIENYESYINDNEQFRKFATKQK